MTTQAIIARAWQHKDHTAPLDTILDSLGLDAWPRLHTHGPEAVNRCSEVVGAWCETVGDRGLRAALPAGNRQGQKAQRIRWECSGCGEVRMLIPSEAGRRVYCGSACATRSRYEEVG